MLAYLGVSQGFSCFTVGYINFSLLLNRGWLSLSPTLAGKLTDYGVFDVSFVFVRNELQHYRKAVERRGSDAH